MFSRTWLTVLAGSVVLWGMNQLGGGFSPPDAGAGALLPVPVPPSPAAAAAAVPGLAFVPRRGRGRRMRPIRGPWSGGTPSAVVRCWKATRSMRSSSFTASGRGRAVVAILDREARLAVELAAAPQAGALDPDLVWTAALGRAASDVRAFEADLVAWFDARASLGGDTAVLDSARAAEP